MRAIILYAVVWAPLFFKYFKDLLIFSCALEPEIEMKLKCFKNMHKTRESRSRKTRHGSSRNKLHIVLAF